MEAPPPAAFAARARHGGPSRGGRARLVATILMANFQNAVLAGSRLVVPMAGLDLGASKALVGLIAALFTALPMLASVRFGRWLDRVGTRVPMIGCTALMLGACLLVGLVPALATLALAAALVGLAAVGSHIAGTRAVASFGAPADRARYFGYLAVGYSVFQFVGPMLAGFAYDDGGTGTAFLALGMLPLAALLLLVLTRFHLFAAEAAPVEARATGGSRDLLRVAGLRHWIVVYAVFSAAHTLFPFVLSLHAVEIGMRASQAGMALGAVAAGSMIARAGASAVAARFGPRRLLAVALVLAAGAYGALPFTHSWGALLPLCFALGLSLGIGTPIVTALIYGAAPEGRMNESLGLAMSLTNFLQLATPLGFGLVAATFGVAPMVWLLAAFLVAAGARSGR